jgi:antitoxin (DNA-binding transcriptional repressor) of toxin-antitoxin stability system
MDRDREDREAFITKYGQLVAVITPLAPGPGRIPGPAQMAREPGKRG